VSATVATREIISLLAFEFWEDRFFEKRREDRRKTYLDGCDTAKDVGAAGAVVGHEKLEERERERKVVQF
jgi:hypothetical protein